MEKNMVSQCSHGRLFKVDMPLMESFLSAPTSCRVWNVLLVQDD